MEPGSVDTYTSALRQALLASTPDELLVDAVERRLNALASKRKSGSSATHVYAINISLIHSAPRLYLRLTEFLVF